MTPRRKGARFLIHPMFARQLAYQLSRNKVAKLMQYTQLVRGWFCPFGFSSFLSFHRWFLNRNHRLTTRPTFFFCYLWDVIETKGICLKTSKPKNQPPARGGKTAAGTTNNVRNNEVSSSTFKRAYFRTRYDLKLAKKELLPDIEHDVRPLESKAV